MPSPPIGRDGRLPNDPQNDKDKILELSFLIASLVEKKNKDFGIRTSLSYVFEFIFI